MRCCLRHSGHEWKRIGSTVMLPSLLLVSSVMGTPVGLAADRHSHHADAGPASTETVLYRESGPVLHDRMMEEV